MSLRHSVSRNERRAVNGNITQCSRAVILYVGIRRVQQADEHGYRPSINELLAVLVGMGHVEECTGRISLDAHVLRTRQSSQWHKCPGLRDLRLVVVLMDEWL